jgi:hypothetical protein
MAQHEPNKPYRVGVFRTAAQADRAVRDLMAAGFSKDEIAVVCSNQRKEGAVAGGDVERPKPDVEYSMRAIGTGGAVGATIGGLALAATAVATGGATLAAGAVLMAGGAIGGAFVGAMTTRALEGELGAYYEQAIRQGDVLVAAEAHGPEGERRLAEAERVLARAGTHPVPLQEAGTT